MKNRLKLLQNYLKKNNLDAFFVPREDEHLNEYLPSSAERLKWISNFSGSAGIAIILKDKAAIFTDGRYKIQIDQEVNKKLFSIHNINNFYRWIDKNFQDRFTVAFDPWLLSIQRFEDIKKCLRFKKIKICQLNKNPIDILWTNKPKKPASKAFLHNLEHAGETSINKIRKIQSILKKKKCDYLILTALDSIAWLLNLRGSDIQYTPVNLAYAIIPSNGKVSLYIDKKKFSNSILTNFSSYVVFLSPLQISKVIARIRKNSIVALDDKKTPYWFVNKLVDKKISVKRIDDPCYILKAKKNYVELQGAKNANIRDGISLTKFLYWLKKYYVLKNIDEITAHSKLLDLRKMNKKFISPSFNTISAFGPNAAIPHYRVSQKSNLKLLKNSIYLVDSGAQYLDGTTDITRTIILGAPTLEQKDRFTRVLKGHIALVKCVFDQNTRGSDIDYLARQYLKKIHCDYEHGTGHGIGSFLSVHEGPQRIAKVSKNKDPYLEPGMILSNEPGFYKAGEYGIRIENLIIVNKLKNNKLAFETISWAPIDKNLMLLSLLTKSEIKWINKYHNRVFNNIAMYLSINEKNWLKRVTKPI